MQSMFKSVHILNRIIFIGIIVSLSCELYSAEKADLYQIELLLIKHADYQAGELEKIINPSLVHRLQQPALNIREEKIDGDIKLITDSQRFNLSEYKEKLNNSDLFETLLHIAWEQPPYYRTEAKYIDIVGEPVAGLLKGLAWVSYEQYFLLRLDFQYDTSFQQKPQTLDIADSKDSVVSIHIKKVMKTGELYYLDHPTIGVLAYISAVTEDSQSGSTSSTSTQSLRNKVPTDF